MTNTAATRELVDAYTDAWFRRDIDEAGSYVAEDLRFRGSIDRSDQAAPSLEALRAFRALVSNINILSRFYDGDQTALLYDCETDTEAATIRTAEFFHVDSDKIDRIRLVFDATKLGLLMGEPA